MTHLVATHAEQAVLLLPSALSVRGGLPIPGGSGLRVPRGSGLPIRRLAIAAGGGGSGGAVRVLAVLRLASVQQILDLVHPDETKANWGKTVREGQNSGLSLCDRRES